MTRTLPTALRAIRSLPVLLAVTLLTLLLSHASGQDAPPVQGVTVPEATWVIASTLLGWAVKEIASSPLTALLKRRYGFQGNTTRLVYTAVSILFVALYGLQTGAFGHGPQAWMNAAVALTVALIKGFGDYASTRQAASPPSTGPADPQ